MRIVRIETLCNSIKRIYSVRIKSKPYHHMKPCSSQQSEWIEPREVNSSLEESQHGDSVQPDIPNEQTLTFREFFPIFMELHGNNQSESMKSSYKLSFSHLTPGFGNLRLSDISKIKMQTYITRRKRKGVSNATVNREVTFLKSLLQRAVDWEYLDRNPLHGLKPLKESPIRERYLTKEEGERLIQAAPDYLRDIIVFALATGFRKSEIFGLTWDNVILNKRFTYGEITVIGKGNKRRNIRMNKTVFQLLCRKSKRKKSQYVFPSPKTGEKIDNVNRAFQTASKKPASKILDFMTCGIPQPHGWSRVVPISMQYRQSSVTRISGQLSDMRINHRNTWKARFKFWMIS